MNVREVQIKPSHVVTFELVVNILHYLYPVKEQVHVLNIKIHVFVEGNFQLNTRKANTKQKRDSLKQDTKQNYDLYQLLFKLMRGAALE